jgi:hypothetical protein
VPQIAPDPDGCCISRSSHWCILNTTTCAGHWY